MGSLSQPRLNIFTVGSMRVMICLGQGGLRSRSASSSTLFLLTIWRSLACRTIFNQSPSAFKIPFSVTSTCQMAKFHMKTTCPSRNLQVPCKPNRTAWWNHSLSDRQIGARSTCSLVKRLLLNKQTRSILHPDHILTYMLDSLYLHTMHSLH